MAIKTIRVCDRCGKYIEYRGWTARIKGLRFRKIFMRKKTRYERFFYAS